MFTTSFPRSGKILIPILRVNLQHWVILMFNIDAKTFSYIDPFHKTLPYILESARELFIQFISYINICKQKNINNVFTENNWALDYYQVLRPYQTDEHSCGAFVTYIMDTIGRNNTFDTSFDPINYRIIMSELLLIESNDMSQVCLFCFGQRHFENVKCDLCNRISHLNCLPRVLTPMPEKMCVLCYANFIRKEKVFNIL